MALGRRQSNRRLGAAQALGMAVFDSFGIAELIDEACGFEGERNLSPGNAVKAICGTMFTENRRQALSNIENFYSYAPVGRLFRCRDDPSSLNDTTLGRCMDEIHSVGTTELFYSISCRIHSALTLVSRILHLDASNITVYKNPATLEEESEEDAIRAMFGKPKDGKDDLLQINFEAIVDEHGLQRYLKCHDGNKADSTMAMEAVQFMKRKFKTDRPILIADSKIVYDEMVCELADSRIPFISKCPENFGNKVRAKIVDLCRGQEFTPIGRLGKRKDSPEYEIFDTRHEVEGDTLRFIAYRCIGGRNDRSIDYYRVHGGKKMESLLGKYRRKEFNCEVDATNEFLLSLGKASEFPFDIRYTVRSETRPGKRKTRGRPRAGECPPPDVTVWKVDCEWEFNEIRAQQMAEDYNIRVIITSLPRADESEEDLRRGASGKDVLKLYLNQFVVENCFREYKSRMGADTLFFQDTRRMEVLLFIIALGAMIRNIIQLVLRDKGAGCVCIPKDITAQRLFRMLTNMLIELDPSQDAVIA
ncbi:MAG: IS1634 family transposase, partial [archaeon]|nr:IS1634 family transposase [archaeon]